jgi:hypothetical protein
LTLPKRNQFSPKALNAAVFGSPKKIGVHMFDDVAGHFKEAPLVLQRNEGALRSIVHSHSGWRGDARKEGGLLAHPGQRSPYNARRS